MLKKLFTRTKKPTMHHIEICISNEAYGDPDVFDRLLERSDIAIEEVGCNSYCEVCDVKPYALVNNELIRANSTTELYDQIVDYIEQLQ